MGSWRLSAEREREREREKERENTWHVFLDEKNGDASHTISACPHSGGKVGCLCACCDELLRAIDDVVITFLFVRSD